MKEDDFSPAELLYGLLSSSSRRKALDEEIPDSKATVNLSPGEIMTSTSFDDIGVCYCPICGIFPKGPRFSSMDELRKHFKEPKTFSQSLQPQTSLVSELDLFEIKLSPMLR